MDETTCRHCGATMQPDEPCPVCELPASSTPSGELIERPLLARLWRSGQLPVGAAALAFLGALFTPLLTRVPMVVDREWRPDTAVRPLDLALNTFPALRGQLTAWMLPGAAVFLLSLLRSRRDGASMRASRMLVAVVSLAPLLSALMPWLKLKKRGVDAGLGPAFALVAVGVVFGLLGALWFGRDVEDRGRRSAHEG